MAVKLLLKSLIVFVAASFALYAGLQAEVIAQVGVTQHIPQLEGDGAGNFVFAVLCLVSGFFVLIKPLIAVGSFALTAVVEFYVGMTYQDHTALLWTVLPVVLSIVCLAVYQSERNGSKEAKRVAVSTPSSS